LGGNRQSVEKVVEVPTEGGRRGCGGEIDRGKELGATAAGLVLGEDGVEGYGSALVPLYRPEQPTGDTGESRDHPGFLPLFETRVLGVIKVGGGSHSTQRGAGDVRL
jgi:hypothetical protein